MATDGRIVTTGRVSFPAYSAASLLAWSYLEPAARREVHREMSFLMESTVEEVSKRIGEVYG